MNKRDLVPIVAEATGLTPEQAKAALDAMLHTIMQATASRESVDLRGFGGFRLRESTTGGGVNPRTGETTEAVHVIAPIFIPGRRLKERLTGRATASELTRD